MTKNKIEQAIQLYRLGLSLEQVGRHFGVTRQAVFYHLKDRTTMRPRGTKGLP